MCKGGNRIKIDIGIIKKPSFKKFKILQIDMNGNLVKEWNSYDEIFSEHGWRYSNIRNCCSGRLAKAYGYKWEIKQCE